MPRISKRKRFASEPEKAAWWEANEEAVTGAFEKAMNEGYVGPCTVVATGDSTATRFRLGFQSRSQSSCASCGARIALPHLSKDDRSRGGARVVGDRKPAAS